MFGLWHRNEPKNVIQTIGREDFLAHMFRVELAFAMQLYKLPGWPRVGYHGRRAFAEDDALVIQACGFTVEVPITDSLWADWKVRQQAINTVIEKLLEKHLDYTNAIPRWIGAS